MSNSLLTSSTKPMIFAFVENKNDALFVGFSHKLRKKHPTVFRVNIARNIKDVKYSILIYFNNKIDYNEFKAITDEIILHFDGNLNVFYKSKDEPYGTKYTYSNINQVVKPDVEKQKIAFIQDDDETIVNLDMTTAKPNPIKKNKPNRKIKVVNI